MSYEKKVQIFVGGCKEKQGENGQILMKRTNKVVTY